MWHFEIEVQAQDIGKYARNAFAISDLMLPDVRRLAPNGFCSNA